MFLLYRKSFIVCEPFFMNTALSKKVEEWYKKSPKRGVSLKILWNQFKKDEDQDISYNQFRIISNKVTKIQSIKTGGYFVRFNDFIDMTVARACNNIQKGNTICIDEKPFVPKKYRCRNLRIHISFTGKGTAALVNTPDPLHNISPMYLLCAISHLKVVLYHISEIPIDSDIFNAFLWKLGDQFPQNSENLFFLCDNASFHNISEITQQYLNNNNCYITRTAKLGCFTNPIEEFFSMVHNYFETLFGQRILSNDSNLTKEEYIKLIDDSVLLASRNCNFTIIYARAGIL